MIKNVLLMFCCTVSFLLGVEKTTQSLHPLLKKFDKDKDGKIFYTEASKKLQEHFCQYDVNQDGYLDKVEIEAIK